MTSCLMCKNKECVNRGRPITYGWDCPAYFNNGYTNSDHIRELGDEKLSKFLLHKIKCTGCNAEHCDEEFCLNMMKDWLQSPCEERYDGI